MNLQIANLLIQCHDGGFDELRSIDSPATMFVKLSENRLNSVIIYPDRHNAKPLIIAWAMWCDIDSAANCTYTSIVCAGRDPDNRIKLIDEEYENTWGPEAVGLKVAYWASLPKSARVTELRRSHLWRSVDHNNI